MLSQEHRSVADERRAYTGPPTPPVAAVLPPPMSAVPLYPAAGPVPPAPPKPRPPRSPLGRLVVSAAVLAVGVLAMVDLAGVSVARSAYLAVPLAVVGAGMVVGAWYGRARALIALGAVLTVALMLTVAVGSVSSRERNASWKPIGIGQLGRSYTIEIGNAVLDLTAIDFAGHSAAVDAHVSMGNLTVIVPSTVDVTVRAKVDVGNSSLFGQEWSGIDQSEHTVTDLGPDGAGGGDLQIEATVDIGDLEVRR